MGTIHRTKIPLLEFVSVMAINRAPPQCDTKSKGCQLLVEADTLFYLP